MCRSDKWRLFGLLGLSVFISTLVLRLIYKITNFILTRYLLVKVSPLVLFIIVVFIVAVCLFLVVRYITSTTEGEI